ncbi:CHAP domain-containing protein [Novosphingobium sp. Leaf2]|uniref:CHAP domain-containing protein n=1 Tax=Novosphingobium sp. Leaf2 TaxID=1735670 RepID=UPI0006F8366D|nr:CHAP domain-containing protein [Novosphingobium sp. Leaf2]KQM18752.1 hypothetical protein ASE49_06235 [Novosphingobium sp. Leaf2]
MRVHHSLIVIGLAVACIAPASARTVIDSANDAGAGSTLTVPKAPGHLECVPFARTTSGIQIYGDAHTWWEQARGRYATGNTPKPGAVMAIKPFNNSRLGHVATVSRIIDSRTVLLSHANWSSPGQIERNVTALDVSPNNDWTQVRIWYAPIHSLGGTHWPVSGFIYNARPGRMRDLGQARLMQAAAMKPSTAKPASLTSRHRDPIGAIISGRY